MNREVMHSPTLIARIPVILTDSLLIQDCYFNFTSDPDPVIFNYYNRDYLWSF